MSIRGVIFDCFGVMYVDMARDFFEKNVKNYTELQPQLLELNKQSDYGFISIQEWISGVRDITGLDTAFVAEHIMALKVRNEVLLAFSQSLRPTHKLGLLSNVGISSMENYFPTTERAALFDATVLSSEVGLIKPHPEIFKLMAERLECSPGDCIMIDDSEENCSGADAAGMQAIHYKTNEQTIRDLESILN